jgi:hypothetical protein
MPQLVPGVDNLCAVGTFVPKPLIHVGLSVDTTDGSYSAIVTGFTNLGYPPTTYSDVEVASGQPALDGVTVLVLARKVLDAAVTQEYVDGVRAFIQQGGSILAELDGAALFFNTFVGVTPSIPNFDPTFGIFTGQVAGGDAILPITNSTMFVSDPGDPLMAGMPSSMLLGTRSAYAISGFNNSWLHVSATFTATGSGLVPAGTFPAVMSASCGSGRVALFTMNHLSVINRTPANVMFGNALMWLTGN